MQHDNHLIPWLSAKFNLTVNKECIGFSCWVGDYDLDCRTGSSDTALGAALDYVSCYDGELFDKISSIAWGE